MFIIGIIGVAYAATKAAEKVTELLRENSENKAYGYRPVILAAPSFRGAPTISHETALTTTELRNLTRGVDLARPDRVAAAKVLWQ
jgi:hypothetical protein